MSFDDIPVAHAQVPATIDGLLQAYRSAQLSPSQVIASLWARWHAGGLNSQDCGPDGLPACPSADPAWIMRASRDQLQTQLDGLASRLQALRTQRPGVDPFEALPLYGIPFAVKDNIDVAGLPTTAACAAFAHMPDATAQVVRRLLDAGAIVVGKTNLDQFATGLVGQRSPYGAPSCTFSSAHVSGGSSSGSAVVVARGEVPFALGTDTAGSGRVPAGFNNLVGMKPTPGLVPTHGVVPACKSLDCVSIFSLTVEDAARVLSVIAGPMAGQACFASHTGAHSPGLPEFASALRVGLPAQPKWFGDADYAQAFDRACAALHDWPEQPDLQTKPVDFSLLWSVASLLYDGPWVAERQAGIADFLQTHGGDLHPVIARVLAAAQDHDAIDAFKGLYALTQWAAQLSDLWTDVDVLMVPTSPTLPTQASVADDPIGRNSQLGTYTNFVNLLGWSAIAVPAGLSQQGLPFGVTFIAPGGRDAALLALATRWQAHVRRLHATQTVRWGEGAGLGHRLPWPMPSSQQSLPAGVTPLKPPSRATMAVAVVGAHLAGMPLHGQLQARQARLLARTHTAPAYRLLALPHTTPPKPALARLTPAELSQGSGARIEIEVYELPQDTVGSFLSLIPPPLGLGSIELEDGRWVHGFICEAAGLQGAQDISHFGGWRAYVRSLSAPPSPPSLTTSSMT